MFVECLLQVFEGNVFINIILGNRADMTDS